jgi:hypothetical protein
MEAVDTLVKYGTSYQSKVVASLLSDSKFLEQVCDITKVDFFESDSNKWIIKETLEYFDEYRTSPTLSVFKVKVGEIEDKILKQAVVEQLRSIFQQVTSEDLPFIKDEYLVFCKNQKIKEALYQSVELLKAGQYEKIVDTMSEASKVGSETNLGLDFMADFDKILENVKRNAVPTGWDVIDELMDGGLGPGELGVIMAPTGIGKTWFLSKIVCNAIKKNLKVLHYSLELSENYVGQRYITVLTGVPTANHKEQEEEIKHKISLISGKPYIKYYPPQFASSKTISAHVQKMRLIGFNADLIIIDYADLLKVANTNRGREGSYEELGGIYEELRGISGELGIPIWTASQTNRDSVEHEIIQGNSIGDSFKKAQTADFIFSVSRKTKDKLSNTGRVHIVKNRFGPDGMTFPAKIDTFHGIMDIYSANSANGIITQKESKNGEGLEKKLLHKKYIENMPQSTVVKHVDGMG